MCALLLTTTLMAQSQDFSNALQNKIRIPNSPEAEAFMKYGDYSVNLYSGTPNISVPLHTHQGREMALPMELTYDASGVKVTQLSTSAGLGWNLRVGGRVSRIMNGGPDDYSMIEGPNPGYYTFRDGLPTAPGTFIGQMLKEYAENNQTFGSDVEAIAYLDFLRDIDAGLIDAQIDYYTVNVGGLNAFVVFNLGAGQPQPRVLNNPRIKAEAQLVSGSLESWTITGEDGTKYYFEDAEETKTCGDDWLGGPAPGGSSPNGICKTYNSSWLLTRIESPNGLDNYEFNYTSLGRTEEGVTQVGALSEVNNTSGLVTPTTFPLGSGSQAHFQPTTEVERTVLSTITHNNNSVVSINYKLRDDYAGPKSAINVISIFETDGLYRQIRFDHSYFSGGTGRLKLDGLTFLNANGQPYGHDYSFTYIQPDLVPEPDVNSVSSQDYLGYFNGRSNGNNLIPRYDLESAGDVWVFEGANRTPDPTKSQYGTLKDITYPTGGRTEFEYESHGTRAAGTEGVMRTREYLVLQGAVGNPMECGGECDQWSATPTFAYKVIYIPETKTYQVDIALDDQEAVAYLHKLDDDQEVSFLGLSALLEKGNWTNNNPFTENITLEAGYYQMTLANANVLTTSTFYVNEEVIQTVPGEPLAGQRIKSIRNFDESGYASGTEYIYGTQKRLSEPTLITFNTSFGSIFEDFSEGQTSMMRVSQAAGSGNVPHIAYESVKVVKRSSPGTFGNGTYENGYTMHDYSAGPSGWQTLFGVSSYFSSSASFGKEIATRTYPAPSIGTDPIESVDRVFDRKQVNSNRTIVAKFNPELYPHFAIVYPSLENGSTVYRIKTSQCVGICLQAPSFGFSPGDCPRIHVPLACEFGWSNSFLQLQPDVALNCEDRVCGIPGVTCYGEASGLISDVGQRVAGLQAHLSIASGHNEYEQSSTRTYQAQDTNDQLLEVNETWLANDLWQNVRSRTRTNSEGHKDSVVFHYPTDFSDGVSIAMRNDRQLNRVIESELYELEPDGINPPVEILRSTQRINYAAVGSGYYPASREIAVGDNPLEVREVFAYNTAGNVQEAETIQEPGVKQTFLWSYDSRFMVAHIRNADYATVESALTSGTISYIQNNDLPDGELMTLLQPLYTIPGAHVTLYAHKPGRGISETMDNNQLRTYYEYDAEGRLKRVVDDRGNIRQQYEYNFAND